MGKYVEGRYINSVWRQHCAALRIVNDLLPESALNLRYGLRAGF
jgi:hypothetical protein